VKNASECAKNLTELLQKLPEGEPPVFVQENDPVAVLVLSFLMWESSTEKALAAYARLFEFVADFNDLRVCMPHETTGYLGARYPKAAERSERLRATLRNIFLREHAVSLEAHQGETKREIRKYLESLEGMVPYVASRVLLLCFDTHTMPVDELLRGRLMAAGAIDEEATVAEVSSWLSRHIKARDGRKTHFAFQAWIDRLGGKSADRSRRKKTRRGKSSGSKSHRKTGDAEAPASSRAADSAT
jgi:endonuclease III